MSQMLFSEYLGMLITQITLGASERKIREHVKNSFGQEGTDEIPSALWPRGVFLLMQTKARFHPVSLGKSRHLHSRQE